MASHDEGMAVSLSMVNVQELVKRPLESVPKQFIRNDLAPCQPPINSKHLPKIPTIDLKKVLESPDMNLNDELGKLHLSCKEWGMFQLVNHGLNLSFLQELRQGIEEFFKLPIEEKIKYKQNPGENEGYGNLVRNENHVDWCDRFLMTVNPLSLRKPHLFLELPASIRSTLEIYIAELQRINIQILRSLAVCLGISKDLIMDLFDEEKAFQMLRMSYYPQCPQPEKVIGLTPHSDGSAITILHQMNGVDGLQVKKDGVWIPVDIPTGAFVVNIGDIMEIMSNGIYRSIEHRVMVNNEHERISLVMFFDPKLDAEVGPLAASPTNQPVFRTLSMEEYLRGFFSRKLDRKSYLDQLKFIGNDRPCEA